MGYMLERHADLNLEHHSGRYCHGGGYVNKKSVESARSNGWIKALRISESTFILTPAGRKALEG